MGYDTKSIKSLKEKISKGKGRNGLRNKSYNRTTNNIFEDLASSTISKGVADNSTSLGTSKGIGMTISEVGA